MENILKEYPDRTEAVSYLHEKILAGEDANEALWQAIIAYQEYPLYTSSGLPFQYTVKRNRAGDYSGELIINRKEGSKTLTRSSVMFAFHKVIENMGNLGAADKDGTASSMLLPPEYKGPKAIGQIFGISYVYSLFWKLGLIKVPKKVEEKLQGINEQRINEISKANSKTNAK